MLRIGQDIHDAIVGHARRDHPDEACGIVAGTDGSDAPTRHVPMLNAERSPTFFRFDSTEQLKVWRDLDDRQEVPIVIYHSHTATGAYPSRTDIDLAFEPDAHYVLVSTADCGNDAGPVEFRSYKIVDGVVIEEEVDLVASVAARNCVGTRLKGHEPHGG
ncbi:MAG: M67 family metallopeptidase [Propionibacteriales bacterium]|nr:M67 family metallopeptidase [Propionibacteriales bacterium]